MIEVDNKHIIEPDSQPAVWRSRGYLPHYDAPGLFQLLTFRLYDSLPSAKLAELNRAGRLSPMQIRNRLEAFLDAGYGACWLRDARIATLMQDTLLHFDGERYRLLAWVVMPNHVHVLAQLRGEFPLAKVMHSWKGYSANMANKLLGRSGQFWQREYYDRYIRNEEHYRNAVSYIEGNPVRAGLAEQPEKWPFSSAGLNSLSEKSAPLG